MKCIYKLIFCYLIFLNSVFYNTAFAEGSVQSDISIVSSVQVDAEDDLEQITGKLETILEPDNNELERGINGILKKYSDNWLVKIINKIISIISSFLDAIFKLATEAARVGVD